MISPGALRPKKRKSVKTGQGPDMRTYGILLHISSLPSAWGIGDLGPAAFAFADLLTGSGASLWQVLPLNPTSAAVGNSPYSGLSAFAGNPLFVSPELMRRDGWISAADLENSRHCAGRLDADPSRVDFEAVGAHRKHLFHAAFERNSPQLRRDGEFQSFCREQGYWLHDFARFVTLRRFYKEAPWCDWPAPVRERDGRALEEWDARAETDMLREKFIQYLFYAQWSNLRAHCRERGIMFLGDAPYSVTHDSADCWSNSHFFKLDENMRPAAVSGVPPDYFSVDGQRWGTPVYRWDALAADGFDWWKKRLGHALKLVDMLRLDHFRGFCAYWEIPAEEKTAVNGRWSKAPAEKFLSALQEYFGSLPVLAEDLGVITDDVREIMERFDLPGMHVLQFGFSGDPGSNPNVPHNHRKRSFVYTGTHDNAPTRDWFSGLGSGERENLSLYSGLPADEDNAALILARMAFASVAERCVLPAQDVLNLGAEGRMNIPGLAAGNWNWRMTQEQLGREDWRRPAEFARIYGRDRNREITLTPDADSAPADAS
ncbi:MAG: 4-alpha-glucanotransferase [Desulfovibrio sp.]|jgi:4-alpha-glucanotransferase|nr:4-alpha-glucanotransferase [Desulfovibrio sp.]